MFSISNDCDDLLGVSPAQYIACEDESSPTIDQNLVHLLGKQVTEAEISDNRWSPPEANTIPASQMEYQYICLASPLRPAWLG